MTVKIINLIAPPPAQSGGAGKGVPAEGAGVSFAAALLLGGAARGNGDTPSAALAAGTAITGARMSDSNVAAKGVPGGALPALDLHLRLPASTDTAAPEEGVPGATPALTPSAAKDRTLPDHLVGALINTAGERRPAGDSSKLSIEPEGTPTATPTGDRETAPADTDSGHALLSAATTDTPLSGAHLAVATTTAPATVRATSASAQGRTAAEDAQITLRSGTRSAAHQAARAAADEQAADTPLDMAALRAAARHGDDPGAAAHETFVMPRSAVAADGRVPAGETAQLFSPAAPASPASTATAAPGPAPAASPATGAPAFTGQLNAPVGSDDWNQALRQQSLRLSHFGDGRAELTLHPRDLGQIQVSLKMGEQAQLHFAAPNAQVRAAVEAALPQLRHAFAENGIDLGQASVSDQGSPQPDSEHQQPQSETGARLAGAADETAPAPVAVTTIAGRTADGGIDIFA